MTFTPIGQTAGTVTAASQNAVGANAGKTASELSRPNSSAIATWLSQQEPVDMDKAAVLRASSHGVDLRVKYEGRYPTDRPSYTVAVGCEIHGDNRDAALADLKNFMTPPEPRWIEDWLAELSVITAGRGKDGVEAELLINAYSARLSRYPADVVRYALTQRTWGWFPSWHELEKVCEAKASPRRHMIAALSSPVPDPEPKRRPPTADERARIQSLVDEMFPQVSKQWRDAAVAEALKGNCIKEGE
jgi:hypothetical protein